jgi:hypothetical protein
LPPLFEKLGRNYVDAIYFDHLIAVPNESVQTPIDIHTNEPLVRRKLEVAALGGELVDHLDFPPLF